MMEVEITKRERINWFKTASFQWPYGFLDPIIYLIISKVMRTMLNLIAYLSCATWSKHLVLKQKKEPSIFVWDDWFELTWKCYIIGKIACLNRIWTRLIWNCNHVFDSGIILLGWMWCKEKVTLMKVMASLQIFAD